MEDKSEKNPEKNEKTEKTDDKCMGGWIWLVAFSSLIYGLLIDVVIYSSGALMQEFIQHYNLSMGTVVWMGTLLIGTSLAVSPFAGILCRKLGYRECGILGAIISSFSFGLPYFYNELWFLIFCTSVICGIGFGLIYLPSIKIVNIWFGKKRSVYICIVVCRIGLGTFIMGPLIEYLVSTYDWMEAMLIIGLILLIMVPCCLTYKNVKLRTPKEIEIKMIDKRSDLNFSIAAKEKFEIIENLKREEETKKGKKSLFWIMNDYVFVLFFLYNILSNIGYNTSYLNERVRTIFNGMFNLASDNHRVSPISIIEIMNFTGEIRLEYAERLTRISRFPFPHIYNNTFSR
uniref:Slc16a-13 n=1 Tax=Schmidtea mediterranea TaxID=79327 RepID=A0A0H3YK70_SCHMD|nr:slc16a-13 [Schmidtea mediterranea]